MCKLDSLIDQLKRALAEEAEAYPSNGTLEAVKVWRGAFDGLRDDLERLKFARGNRINTVSVTDLVGTSRGY